MQNNRLLDAKIGLVSKVTNQIVPTIYTTKDTQKAKLLTTVKGLVIKYHIDDSADGTFTLVEDKMIQVKRNKNESSNATLVADIYDEDGQTLLLTQKWGLSLLSLDDSENTKLEELHYNNNGLSQKLGYLGIIFLVLNLLITLNTVQATFIVSFIYVLINIAIFLVGFLACEKVKVYKKEYAITLFIIGVISFVMIFLLPLQTMIQYGRYVDAVNAGDSALIESIRQNYLGAALTDSSGVANMLTQSGYVRSVIMIVLLGVSTACFVVAGIVGYFKSIKLNNYLASIKKN